MKYLLSSLMIFLISCNQTVSYKEHIINTEAKKINDSAMQKLTTITNNAGYDSVIILLDKAIKIDNQFYLAYWNKMSILNQIGRYNQAIQVANEQLRLRPDAADIYSIIGMLYDKIGKLDSANNAYKNAESKFNSILDTMRKNNKDYKGLLLNRAINLKLMGQQQQGESILNQLYQLETDSNYKGLIQSFENKSKQELMDALTGKTIDITPATARPIQ